MKLTLTFKGREMQFQDIGKDLFKVRPATQLWFALTARAQHGARATSLPRKRVTSGVWRQPDMAARSDAEICGGRGRGGHGDAGAQDGGQHDDHAAGAQQPKQDREVGPLR